MTTNYGFYVKQNKAEIERMLSVGHTKSNSTTKL